VAGHYSKVFDTQDPFDGLWVEFDYHALINTNMAYDVWEDDMMIIFASLIDLSFTSFAIATAIFHSKRSDWLLDISIGLLATLWSVLMSYVPGFRGTWQRAIFLFVRMVDLIVWERRKWTSK
jgi:hypothetical protein